MNENKVVANILEIVREYVKLQSAHHPQDTQAGRTGRGSSGLGTSHCRIRILPGNVHSYPYQSHSLAGMGSIAQNPTSSMSGLYNHAHGHHPGTSNAYD